MTNSSAFDSDPSRHRLDVRRPALDSSTMPEDMKSLQSYASLMTGGIAVPTILVSLAAITGLLLFTSLAIAGTIPAWLASLLNIVCFVAAYTGVHEAIHQNFHGKNSRYRILNDIFGIVLMFPFFHSFTMHKYVHLQHHAHTNDLEKDPDAWMAVNGFFPILVHASTLVFYYFIYTVRMKLREPNPGPFLRRAALETLAPVVIALILTAMGYGLIILVVWVAPALITVAILGVFLDWLVHHPHQGNTRFSTTRIFAAPPGLLGKLLNWAYFFQNYHLIHHLFPRAPFYHYEQIFQHGEEILRNEGATIIKL